MTTRSSDKVLFAYGTLINSEILHRVIGSVPASEPARLNGFQARCVKGATYPGLLRYVGGTTNGMLYQGLSESQWKKLDRFEGPEYERIEVEVIVGGNVETAQTYLYKSTLLKNLEPCVWDYKKFMQKGRQRFLQSDRCVKM